MSRRRAPLALYHIRDAISDFLEIIGDRTVEGIAADKARRYAAERCVEIISEASRRVPVRWKNDYPHIPWKQIAGIGNVMRHNYEDVNLDIIVGLRGPRLDALLTAVTELLRKHDPEGQPFFDQN